MEDWQLNQPKKRRRSPLPFEQEPNPLTPIDYVPNLASQRQAERRNAEQDALTFQKQQEKQREAQERARLKAENDQKEADYRARGVKTYSDSTGIKPILNPETGKETFSPQESEVQTDDKGAFKVKRKEDGQREVLRDSVKAVESDFEDPNTLNIQTSLGQSRKLKLDDALNDPDQKVVATAARELHK